MSIKRLLPGRWVRIIGWTLAGVSWGTTAVAVAAGAGQAESPAPSIVPVADTSAVTTVAQTPLSEAPLPEAPATGLVILRFTPVERPEAQVITRTVTASAPAGAPAASQPSAPVTVTSSGS